MNWLIVVALASSVEYIYEQHWIVPNGGADELIQNYMYLNILTKILCI